MTIQAPRIGALVAAALTLFAVTAMPVRAQVDMTGTWNLEVDVMGQVSNPSMTLQQDGMALTGHYSSETLGETDVTGTVDGDTVTVTFEVEAGGQGGTVSYVGTVNSEGVWTGQFSLAGLADGTFTGTKAS
ncbi:MAG: hypothetical protein PVJ80_14935 [Gemmatimonadota bacterium]|jgi:hypothetical protein